MTRNKILNIFFLFVLLKQALFTQTNYSSLASLQGSGLFSGFLRIINETTLPAGYDKNLNNDRSTLKKSALSNFLADTKTLSKPKNIGVGEAQEATLNFATQNINTTSSAKTFTIRGSALKNSVVIAATFPFVISKDSIVYKNAIGYSTEELTANQVVYVKFKPTYAGKFTGSIINTSDGADSKYLNLTGTAIDPNTNITENQIVASNIITPNGDGKNDTWIVKNIEFYPSNTVKVFDKSGRVVYSKQNYTNDWNGTYNNAPLSQGTYFYVVEFGAGLGILKGYITIIRD